MNLHVVETHAIQVFRHAAGGVIRRDIRHARVRLDVLNLITRAVLIRVRGSPVLPGNFVVTVSVLLNRAEEQERLPYRFRAAAVQPIGDAILIRQKEVAVTARSVHKWISG